MSKANRDAGYYWCRYNGEHGTGELEIMLYFNMNPQGQKKIGDGGSWVWFTAGDDRWYEESEVKVLSPLLQPPEVDNG